MFNFETKEASLQYHTVILGAGPAGLTAGYLLVEHYQDNPERILIFEANPKYVGGISRTERHNDFYFDIGGHRFFSKSQEVEDFWTKILGPELLVRPRSSRIFYRKNFYAYPLKAFEALRKLGLVETTRCVMSYAYARVRPIPSPKNFEDWVTNQFGKRLFQIFFKTYTEKVWGMSCRDISSDWAAQRIKGLSLGEAIWNALKPRFLIKRSSKVIKTLIESFRYPARGPGMMWEKAADDFQKMGGDLRMGSTVTSLTRDEIKDAWIVTALNAAGEVITVEAKHVISSAPIRDIARAITPRLQSAPRAESLKYRDFLTIALMVKEKMLFDDNWIYIHEPNVLVGRIQNFKSWSPYMVPREDVNCYGLEYFCQKDDALWSLTDAELVALAQREILSLGLALQDDILDGCVVRQEKAYPVYDQDYAENIRILRQELEEKCPKLYLVGRNGMHKYNNQDHAIMTSMLTVKNIVAGENLFDVWKVNQDAEYHETAEVNAPV